MRSDGHETRWDRRLRCQDWWAGVGIIVGTVFVIFAAGFVCGALAL